MNQTDLLRLLADVKTGALGVDEACGRLLAGHDTHGGRWSSAEPTETPVSPSATGPTGDLVLDTDRHERLGFPEAIYAAGKTCEQVVRAFRGLLGENGRALATRCAPESIAALRQEFGQANVHEQARVVWAIGTPPTPLGRVAVLAAGTSDLPVAEEAALTAEFGGATVERIYDVGVAGIHRLLGRLDAIRTAEVVIVVAGMEGALPSVVGGLIGAPIVAVPTSVGYGASFAGLTALLAMLNSCAAGIPVVNIDNGFGAAVAAVRILKRRNP